MGETKAGLPSATSGRSVGLIQIDDALLALDTSVLREVIRCPQSLLRLPSRCSGIIGAVTLRGTIIPVLDLGQALGMPARSTLDGVIIVLRCEGRVLGLLADAICGMAVLADADLQCLKASQVSSGPQLTEYGFEVGNRIATLLDGQAICGLPDVPMVAERTRSSGEVAAAETRPYLVFEFAGAQLALDAICVEGTVPRTPIQTCSLTVGRCLGVISYLGAEIPIVDSHGTFGLGPKPAPEACEAVVVRFPAGGMLALTIDAVRDIPRLGPVAIKPLPPVARGAVGLLKGMTSTADGRLCLVIDEDALRADPHLSALSRLCKPQAAPKTAASPRTGDSRSVTADPRPYLVYTAGEVQTTPLVDVNEIVIYPATVTLFDEPSDGLVGLFHHRGVVVPLIHLASYLGFRRPVTQHDARVLLMQDGSQHIGFIIDMLHSVEPAQWRTATPDKASSAACERSMALIGAKEKARLVWHQDLRSIMRKILASAEAGDEAAIECGSALAPDRQACA